MTLEIISRNEAIAAGLKFYFTGKPCGRGHISKRMVVGNSCVECLKETRQKWYSLNRKYANAVSYRWRKENPEKTKLIAERNKPNQAKWRLANKEYLKEYSRVRRLKNLEREHERNKAWRQANPERKKATGRKWREEKRDQIRAHKKDEYVKNKESYLARARNRKALKRANGGKHTAKDIAELFEMQRGKCAYCRERLNKKRHIDHIIPLSLGGSNDRSNLQILCAFCNVSKGARHPMAYAQSLGLLL